MQTAVITLLSLALFLLLIRHGYTGRHTLLVCPECCKTFRSYSEGCCKKVKSVDGCVAHCGIECHKKATIGQFVRTT